MKRKKHSALIVFLVIAIASFALPAAAETLSWNAVTTYTDGTSIGSTTVTYQGYWSTNSGTSGLTTLGSSTTSTSVNFNIDTAGMPRGQTIYFRSRATVAGVNSAYSTALSWTVPATATKTPTAPSNLHLQ
jgi:hypothetical protein